MPIQVKIFLTQIQGLNSALLAPTHYRFHTSYFTTPNSLHFATPYMIDRVECMHISKVGPELDYFIRHRVENVVVQYAYFKSWIRSVEEVVSLS